MVFLSGTLSQTLYVENIALVCQSSIVETCGSLSVCSRLLHSAWSESRPKNVVFGIFDQKSRIAQHFQPSIYHNAAVRARIRQKERFGGSRAQTGSRNMAATRFSDSATPTCFKTKSRPKYTTTSGLTATTFFCGK